MIINDKEFVTVTEAVKLTGRTRQAIHQKMKGSWQDKCIQQNLGGYTIWLIPKEIIDNYKPQNYPFKLGKRIKTLEA